MKRRPNVKARYNLAAEAWQCLPTKPNANLWRCECEEDDHLSAQGCALSEGPGRPSSFEIWAAFLGEPHLQTATVKAAAFLQQQGNLTRLIVIGAGAALAGS